MNGYSTVSEMSAINYLIAFLAFVSIVFIRVVINFSIFFLNTSANATAFTNAEEVQKAIEILNKNNFIRIYKYTSYAKTSWN